MTSIKLTAKETALMTAIADRFFSFFDDGLRADSGIWQDCMGQEIAGVEKYNVSATPRGVATVATSLARKGLLVVAADADDRGDSAWTYLTEAGQAWCEEHNEETEDEVFESIIAAREEAAAPVVEEAATEEISSDTTVTEVETPEGEALVTEWTTEGTEDIVSWTEVTFPDASRTIKRRQKVSGSWRTDYWGAEFAGDAERLTTSAKVKAAIAKGNFTR